jgi:hypothetical protein
MVQVPQGKSQHGRRVLGLEDESVDCLRISSCERGDEHPGSINPKGLLS